MKKFLFLILFFTLANTAKAYTETTSIVFDKELSQSVFINDADADLDFSKSFTIESMIKLTQEPIAGDHFSIFTQWKKLSRGFVFTYSNRSGQNGLRFEAQDYTGTFSVEKFTPYNLNLNQWYNLALTYDMTTGNVNFYVDGNLIANYIDFPNRLNKSNADIVIGNDSQYALASGFDGHIDEVSVWDYAKSQTEILNDIGKIQMGNENGLVAYWRFENDFLDSSSLNNLTPRNNPIFFPELKPVKSLGELVEEIETVVEEGVDQKSVQNSYFSHIKKIVNFFEEVNPKAALNQILVVLKKIGHDENRGDLVEETAFEMTDLSKQIEEIISDGIYYESVDGVPLLTQVTSPYPPESVDWADDIYGDGSPDWCGNTIAGCGCAITSMSMLGLSYGLTSGYDGSDVNPGNMNTWLKNNNGYTSLNTVRWHYALQYLSPVLGKTYLSLDKHNSLNLNEINSYVSTGQPAIAYKKTKGHYFVLTDLLEDGNYAVNDPLWYETKTTNDVKDIDNNVQGYEGGVDQANLYSYSKQLKSMPKWVEIQLGSPAELLLTDSQGRRAGFDPDTGDIVLEIPGSSYSQSEGVVSVDEISSEVHQPKMLMVNNPDDYLYDLTVIGTGNGEYTLSIDVGGGSLYSEIESITGLISDGDEDYFVIDVPDGASSSRAVERLRELSKLKEGEQPVVAERLSFVADKLVDHNNAKNDFSLFSVY